MELKLKIGIGHLLFGMTRDQVSSIMGPPNATFIDIDDSNQLICEWNDQKLRLTFYNDEMQRFGYLTTSSPNLKINDQLIIGQKKEKVFETLFNQLDTWETEDFQTWTYHFNEKNWLGIHEEYGVITEVELGVPFKNDDDYDWPSPSLRVSR